MNPNRKPIIAGNWKMNKTAAQSKALASELKTAVTGLAGAEIVVCPTFTSLAAGAGTIRGPFNQDGAQNVPWEKQGAFTSEYAPSICDPLVLADRALGVIVSRAAPAAPLAQFVAEVGFPVSPRLHAMVGRDAALASQPAARDYFFGADGRPKAVGTMLRNPAYADTLRASPLAVRTPSTPATSRQTSSPRFAATRTPGR